MSNTNVPTKKEQPISLLRLGREQLGSILLLLEKESPTRKPHCDRKRPRYLYIQPDRIKLTVEQPTGPPKEYLTTSRNLSTTGINLIHGSYIHEGVEVGIEIIDLNNEGHQLTGEIIRCRLLKGHIHQIGIKFHKKIEIEKFITAQQLEQWPADLQENDDDSNPQTHGEIETPQTASPASEKVAETASESAYLSELEEDDIKREQYHGNVLYIEDVEIQQKLAQKYFSSYGIKIDCASSASSAFKKIAMKSYDLILTDINLPDIPGYEVIQKIREMKVKTIIVATSATDNVENIQESQDAGANWFLPKPLKHDSIQQLVRQSLYRNFEPEQAEPMYSKLWSDRNSHELIHQFLNWLESQLCELHELIIDHQSDNLDSQKQLCQDIETSADSYGYPKIAEIARELRKLFEQGNHDTQAQAMEVIRLFNDLLDHSMAACASRCQLAA